MQNTESGYRGLRLLLDLNWDRVLWPVIIAAALALGNYAVSL